MPVLPPALADLCKLSYDKWINISNGCEVAISETASASGDPRLVKPADLYDRDAEWVDLTRFVTAQDPGALLGIMYGRRRQGKTLLLELLAEACDGFLFMGLQQSRVQNLADLAAAYSRKTGLAGASFGSWHDAIDALLRLGQAPGLPVPVILDEFGYLTDSAPELPSVIQRLLSPRGAARQRSSARLILCGSALSLMKDLVSAGSPLRGRSRLELMIHPFGYRASAGFWGADQDPYLAFRIHALVGGTPAYLDMCGKAPARSRDFDRWVIETLLNPSSAMFREGDILVREEQQVSDPALYHAVLATLAGGAGRRSEIASRLGRTDASLTHVLAMLEQIKLVARLDDALRDRRPVYRIAEPIIRFHQLVVRRNEARLVARAGDRVWAEAADTVNSLIYGPHLEELARVWCAEHASQQTLGGIASKVQPATLSCAEHQQGHELDIVVTESNPMRADRIVAIGEVKSTTSSMGPAQLARLEHIRQLIPAQKAPGVVRLILVSRSGFQTELTSLMRSRDDVVLVDMQRLYGGD